MKIWEKLEIGQRGSRKNIKKKKFTFTRKSLILCAVSVNIIWMRSGGVRSKGGKGVKENSSVVSAVLKHVV